MKLKRPNTESMTMARDSKINELTFLKTYILVLMGNGRIRRGQYEEVTKMKRKYIYMLKEVRGEEDHVSFIK